MSIELHAFDTPNGRKISIALEEMALPYTVKVVDIRKGDQREPGFLKISPNGKIPAIIDTEGPHGNSRQRLRIRRDTDLPRREDGQVLAAATWQARIPGPGVADVPAWRLRADTGTGPSLYRDRRQAKTTVATDSSGSRRKRGDFTRSWTADWLRTRSSPTNRRSPTSRSSAGHGGTHGTRSISRNFPNVRRWYETMMARPAVQRGFAVRLS